MNDKKIKVLLLSAPIGSGHRLAAEALQSAFAKYNNVEIVHGNVFDFFPAILGKTFLKVYLWILGACPWLYEMMYKWGNKGEGSLWLRSLINGALAYLGSSFIKRVAPDVVIATHATPAGIMSIYKRRNKSGLYLCGVITDFTVHRWWLCEGVDTYFIADELLKEKFPKTQELVVTGIPLREGFGKLAKELCRKEFGWKENEKVCLLMGGGEGLLPMEEIITALQNHKPENLRLVALTGKNDSLAKSLMKKFAEVEVLGFTDKVPQLMCGADIIISKAGGVSSAEILASNLDFIIYKPLPGQEENNAKFLAANYGATIANNVANIKEEIASLCKKVSKDNINKKKIFGRPDASHEVCEFVLARLKNISPLDR